MNIVRRKSETLLDTCSNYHRILNKRLSRMILYGKQKLDIADRCTVLERCVEEISRIPENESCKFILLKIRI